MSAITHALVSSWPAMVLVAVLGTTAISYRALPVRTRAGICANKDCTTTRMIAFEPVNVRVTYSIDIHPDNRALSFALLCTSGEYPSVRQLNGDLKRPNGTPFDDPQFIVLITARPGNHFFLFDFDILL